MSLATTNSLVSASLSVILISSIPVSTTVIISTTVSIKGIVMCERIALHVSYQLFVYIATPSSPTVPVDPSSGVVSGGAIAGAVIAVIVIILAVLVAAVAVIVFVIYRKSLCLLCDRVLSCILFAIRISQEIEE